MNKVGLVGSCHWCTGAIGFTASMEDNKRKFVYMIPEVSLNHKLIPTGKLVLATQIKSRIIFNNNYEF